MDVVSIFIWLNSTRVSRAKLRPSFLNAFDKAGRPFSVLGQKRNPINLFSPYREWKSSQSFCLTQTGVMYHYKQKVFEPGKMHQWWFPTKPTKLDPNPPPWQNIMLARFLFKLRATSISDKCYQFIKLMTNEHTWSVETCDTCYSIFGTILRWWKMQGRRGHFS